MSVFAAPDSARRHGPRALGERRARLARGAAGLLLATVLAPFGAAQAQSAGASGQIYIPGPGEAHASAPSGAAISIPGPGEARAATATAATGTPTSQMIVIPGPGEAGAANAASELPRISAQPRPSTMPAAARVMPVLVTAPQRTVRSVQPIAIEQPANSHTNAVAANVPASAGVAAASTGAPVAAALAPASNAPAGQEDGETIRRAALAFLQQQTVGLPGKITITVAPSFPRGLAACTTLEPFMPTGARLWGTTSVGVRCAGAKPWTLYLQARIAIESTYYLAARQIDPGSLITAQDLLARNGDLSNLPRAIITDPSQAVGSTAIVRIGAGMPLRQDLLKSASAVTIGQTVKVVAQGQGFTISSEGSVMNNASPGQQVRVKMAGGQIISGTVVDGATVQVQM
ncbi:flagellar basal body P-ring formation chaperone FlgA [Trinickia sp. NRRL B-1857]|uniref:flagellar basal body P-ring formation chaperone FlgA n=1 Tax=Trinickia sp. NRRL B-1857 TaxID=3162879 RepID=UPI003D2B6EB5